MQIVIEIPDRLIDNEFGYIDIRLHKDEAHVNSITTPDYDDPYYAELQFNVLPRGHGDLIDRDLLRERISEDRREAFTKHEVWLLASKYNTDVPVVVPADKDGD